MSYCSTFSLRNSKVHQFLNTLEKDLKIYTEEELVKIAQAPKDQIQRKKIELMFKVEQKRFDKMKKFQKENSYIIDQDSNKLISNESPDYQPIFKEFDNNIEKKIQNRDKRLSGQVQSFRLNKIDNQKRKISLQENFISNNPFKIPIHTSQINGLFNFNFKQDIFDVDEEIELESDESVSYNDKDDQYSIKSEELEDEFDYTNDQGDTFQKNGVALSIVKHRKIISVFDNDLTYINVFGYFSNKNKLNIKFEEDDYNYSILLIDNIIQDQKLLTDQNEFYLSNLKKNENQQELFMGIQDNTQINLSNDNNSFYQYSIPKNLCVQKLEENIDKQFIFDFKDDYFVHKIEKNNFGSFINLNSDKFKDNLIIEQDMVFMFNHKHGFCIREIVKSQNQQQLTDLLLNKYDNCNLLALDLDFDKAREFYTQFLIPQARSFYTDKNILQFNLKNFQMLFNEYFRKYIIQNQKSFLVVGMVDYFQDYQFYKITKTYIIFKTGLKIGNFFDNQSQIYRFIQGKQNNQSISFRQQFFKEFYQFQVFYSLNLGFNDKLKIFYFSYQQNEEKYCNLFSQDSSTILQFRSSDNHQFKEGIWLGLFKFNIFEDFQSNQKGVLLPYQCHIMFNKNILHVQNLKLKIIEKNTIQIIFKYILYIKLFYRFINFNNLLIMTQNFLQIFF